MFETDHAAIVLALRDLGDVGTRYAATIAVVTAVVNDVVIVDEAQIKIALMLGEQGDIIDMYWAESNYRNFRELGLYGRFNTNFQDVCVSGSRELRIQDASEGYLITLRY